jgi:uncharacterized membrane-anchored protein YjiN (DUF445 family)
MKVKAVSVLATLVVLFALSASAAQAQWVKGVRATASVGLHHE